MNAKAFVKLERQTRAGLMSFTVPVDVGATTDDTFNAMSETMGRIDETFDEVEETLLGVAARPAEKTEAKKPPAAKTEAKKPPAAKTEAKKPTARRPQEAAGEGRPPLKPRPRPGASAPSGEAKKPVSRPSRPAATTVEMRPPVTEAVVNDFIEEFGRRIYDLDAEKCDSLDDAGWTEHFNNKLRQYGNLSLAEMRQLTGPLFDTTSQTILAAVNVDLAGGV